MCMYSQTVLYWSTLPCPWLSISVENVHSSSFKEGNMPEIQNDQSIPAMFFPFKLFSPLTTCIEMVPPIYSFYHLMLPLKRESIFVLLLFVFQNFQLYQRHLYMTFFRRRKASLYVVMSVSRSDSLSSKIFERQKMRFRE